MVRMVLGLPSSIRACLFDAFLRARRARTGKPGAPFDLVADYDRYMVADLAELQDRQ